MLVAGEDTVRRLRVLAELKSKRDRLNKSALTLEQALGKVNTELGLVVSEYQTELEDLVPSLIGTTDVAKPAAANSNPNT